jgi:hypothetical protein
MFKDIKNNHDDSETFRKVQDCLQAKRTNIIAVAAPKLEQNQKYTYGIIRDMFENIYHGLWLVKQYHDVTYPRQPLTFVTGRWGCGAFHHDIYVSMYVQNAAIALLLDDQDTVIYTDMVENRQKGKFIPLEDVTPDMENFKSQSLNDISKILFDQIKHKFPGKCV